jgi:hypothetical protein
MTHGGKREGAGRKPEGNSPKTIFKRMTVEDAYRLDNLDKIIAESERKLPEIKTVDSFKIFKLEGEIVIKVNDLIEAGVLKN